ncbi:MAG: hypothetical protein NT120_02500 [Candidatus Aenigmarchaeota archaeon]|nr:hypothetical protein [Candidatus Aenigmarchaeota archaeon]
MSKNFKRQDYFRYKRLGKKWRKPVGLQSKLRIRKGGSGRLVSIGFGTKKTDKNKIAGANVAWVHNVKDLENVDNATAVFIASGVGSKSVLKITEKAKEMNIRIMNMKKVKRAKNLLKSLEKKKKEGKKKEEKKEEKKTEHKEEHKEEHKKEEHKEVTTEQKAETTKEIKAEATTEKEIKAEEKHEHLHGHDHDQEHTQPKDHNPEHEHAHEHKEVKAEQKAETTKKVKAEGDESSN